MFIGASNPKVTIDGGDTATLAGSGITSGMIGVSGNATTLADTTFRHITIANSNITTGLGTGSAIQNFGKLTLDTVTFTQNQAAAIFQELCTGCLNTSLTITHCLFQNNASTTASGAAISGDGIIAADIGAYECPKASGNIAPPVLRRHAVRPPH